MPLLRRSQQARAQIVLHLGLHVAFDRGPHGLRIDRLQRGALESLLPQKLVMPGHQRPEFGIGPHPLQVDVRWRLQTGAHRTIPRGENVAVGSAGSDAREMEAELVLLDVGDGRFLAPFGIGKEAEELADSISSEKLENSGNRSQFAGVDGSARGCRPLNNYRISNATAACQNLKFATASGVS